MNSISLACMSNLHTFSPRPRQSAVLMETSRKLLRRVQTMSRLEAFSPLDEPFVEASALHFVGVSMRSGLSPSRCLIACTIVSKFWRDVASAFCGFSFDFDLASARSNSSCLFLSSTLIRSLRSRSSWHLSSMSSFCISST